MKKESWLILLWLVVAGALVFLLKKTGFFIGNVLLSPAETFDIYFWIIVMGLCLTLIFVSFLIVRNSIRERKESLAKDSEEEN